jgi:hypothetical protein
MAARRSSESGPGPWRAEPDGGGQLGGIEAEDVAHGDQGTVLRVQTVHGREEVQRVDASRRIDASHDGAGVGEKLCLGTPSALAQQVPGLVHSDAHEPGTDPLRLAHRSELVPHG